MFMKRDPAAKHYSSSHRTSLPVFSISDEDAEALPLNPRDSLDGYAERDEDLSHAGALLWNRAPKATEWAWTALVTYRKQLVAFLVFLAGYFLVSYIYTDPLAWPPPRHAAKPVLVSSKVVAAGRRYTGEVNSGTGVASWRSIRYAEDTSMKRRFWKPVPIRELSEESPLEVDALKYDDGCPRVWYAGDGYVGTEDCLSLSIHTPTEMAPGELLPVLVWIHGGGFYSGASHEERYEPADLFARSKSMNQPFVYVAISYRLHGLGFSAAPPPPDNSTKNRQAPHIPVTTPADLDLNVGLKDQVEALRFVRKWIGRWGGDKDKVTLAGHSAGAISVGLHQLYSPPELFRAAFMLSGAPTSFPVPWPHDAGGRTLHPLPGYAQCPSPEPQPYGPPSNAKLLACMRELPLPKLMQAFQVLLDKAPVNGYFPWYPVLEGEWGGEGEFGAEGGRGGWLDVRPSDRIVRGNFAKIPVVLGSVRDEGTRFVETDIGDDGIVVALRGAFDFTYGAIEGILTPILELYPLAPSLGSPYFTGDETFGLSPTYKRVASLLGDVFFQAPRRHFLRETPKDFGEPSWNYFYDEKREGAPDRVGVAHSADLSTWFGHPESKDAELRHLSRHMTAYLINFISNSDPNGPGLRSWPQYGVERKTLHLARQNISITHDSDRIEAMRFINVNNPIFAR